MARSLRPLDPASGGAAAFAAELRALWLAAGQPTFLQMSRRTGRSRTALAEAVGGDHLPTWETVDAFVRACGGAPADWLPRWERARDDLAGARRPSPAGPAPPVPAAPPPRRVPPLAVLACVVSFALGAAAVPAARWAVPGAPGVDPGERQVSGAPVIVATSPFVRYGATAMAVSGGPRGEELRVWDARGRQVRAVRLGDQAITQVAFDPVRQDQAFAGLASGDVRIVDTASGKIIWTYAAEGAAKAPPFAVDPSGSGFLAVPVGNGAVKIWDTLHNAPYRVLRTGLSEVTSLVFDPHYGGRLAIGGDRGGELWEAGTGEPRGRFGDGRRVPALLFDPFTPNTLLVAEGRGASVWDTSSGKRVRGFSARAEVTALCFNPQLKNSLVVGTRAGTVEVWDPSTGRFVRELARHPWPVRSLAYTADAGHVLVGGERGRMSVDVSAR